MAKARTGKIARLPLAIRNEVNRRLRENEPGPKIIGWLHTLPEVLKVLDDYFREEPISPQNLSEWRQGGFVEWLDRLEQVERTKELAAYGYELAKNNNGGAADGVAAITGGQFLEIFESLNVDAQKALLQEKPLTYTELVGAFAKFESAQAKKEVVRQNRRKLEQNDVKLDLDRQKLALDRARFERTTCELFLKFYDNRKAADIAEGKAKKEIKIEQLRLLIFGTPPGPPAEAAAT
ncbi:hypothetical protein [Horticoccus sp. 23ND18S-11]|uniref:hypothetical protein n=1 Tax=Horticoccus sp. 23ND18S-11 TaxID=3391832 RepID=UPI0039C91D0F